MRQGLHIVAATFVCGLALSARMPVQAQTKLWSVRVEKLGWKDPYLKVVPKANAETEASPPTRFQRMLNEQYSEPIDPDLGTIWRQELVVDSAGQVYVGIGVGPEKVGADRALRMVTLDAQHGNMVRQIDLSTPRLDRTALLLAEDDVPLVIAGDQVRRVNKDGTLSNAVPLPPQPEINPSLWLMQSPSGHTLLLTTDEKSFRFLRTDTLATTAECRLENDEIETISDATVLSMSEPKSGPFELHSGPLCGPMSMLWKLDSNRSSSVHLLDDKSLLEISTVEVRRLTLHDKKVWSWKPIGEALPSDNDGLSISRNGERIAVQLTVYHSLHSVGCMECRGPSYESWGTGIAVLNAATGKLVATVPLEHASLNRLAFALSPDGRKLAIMNDGVIELWAL